MKGQDQTNKPFSELRWARWICRTGKWRTN